MNHQPSRRSFLRTAPAAAAAGLALTDTLIALAQPGAAQSGTTPGASTTPAPFKAFLSKDLDADARALQTNPGNNTLVDQSAGFPCSIVMTTEVHKSAAEFEWHDASDHIVQIIDGMTLYEVGGTPKGAHSTAPGQWLAPQSEGSRSILMGKGDLLVLPRGTPYKRSTEDGVTFYLISPSGR